MLVLITKFYLTTLANAGRSSLPGEGQSSLPQAGRITRRLHTNIIYLRLVLWSLFSFNSADIFLSNDLPEIIQGIFGGGNRRL